MGTHRRHSLHKKNHGHPRFWVIYVISVLFNFHGLLVAYSSSTYMGQFVSPETIGWLYTISSGLAVVAFLHISHVLKAVGNVKLTLLLALFEMFALIALGLLASPIFAVIAFILFLTLNPLIYLSIDIFSESLIGKDESSTGSKRGLTLTLMGLAAVLGPLAMGLIVGDDSNNLSNTYLVAAGVFSLFIIVVAVVFRAFKDPKYHSLHIREAVAKLWNLKDVRNVFLAHFTLQIFFTWMVIYLPLYLATEIGLPWDAIGSIIAVGLLAYVFLDFPVGIIGDRWIGEKEMMAIGFIILAITSAWISFMATATVLGWMTVMFISRIGGSLVESTTEGYFFKHTKGSDANLMSFFRLTRPLAGMIGAFLGGLTLLTLPFHLMFVVLGLMMLPGIIFATLLNDTR